MKTEKKVSCGGTAQDTWLSPIKWSLALKTSVFTGVSVVVVHGLLQACYHHTKVILYHLEHKYLPRTGTVTEALGGRLHFVPSLFS